MPISSRNRYTISYDPSTTTLQVFIGPASGPETDDILIRQSKSFGLTSAGLSSDIVLGSIEAGVRPEERLKGMEVVVGLMAASPMGEGEGPECLFKNFEMRDGCRDST